MLQNLKTQFVKDLRDKDTVKTEFIVKNSVLGTDKNGKPYMNLLLGDVTGDVEGKIWEEVEKYSGQVVRDSFVRIQGRFQLYQGRKQVVIQKLQVLREDEVDQKQFIVDSSVNVDELYARLLTFVDSMEDPHYRFLAEEVLKNDAEIVAKLKKAPAAKTMHHAFKGGLIDHMVSVSGLLDQVSKHYGKKLNRDLLLIGGFFHDIAKIWELSYEKTTDYTDIGRLVGHLVMGSELIDEKIKNFQGEFPETKRLLAKHMVLAHHGELAYGSPVKPQCLEAMVVHMIDDFDSKVNAVSTFIEQDQNPGQWTLLNRHYERYFFKHPTT